MKPINVAVDGYRFIQTVIQQIILTNKRKSSTILLKMDSSIQDMKVHYIEKGRSIIGTGKTPHLGSCCMSVFTSYQKAVIQRETNDHSIVLGTISVA